MLRTFIPVLMAVALSTSALANDEHHPETAQKPASSTPANRPASAKATPRKAVITDLDRQFGAAQAQMKKMLADMEKIRQTKDPKERQRLMQDHLQAMQEGAQAMRRAGGGMMDMMQCPMMDDKKDASPHCPMMGKSANKMEPGKMEPGKRMDMMEKRMDMMQIMMEQMIERENQKSVMPPLP